MQAGMESYYKWQRLWIQGIRTKYLQKNPNFFFYKTKATGSRVWKSIVKSKELLRTGIVWKIGTGDAISFWYDNWIENKPLIDILNISEDSSLDPRTKVNEFFLANRAWDVSKLSIILHNHPISNKIIGMDIPHNHIEDSFCWGINSSGEFDTKSVSWIVHWKQPQETIDWHYNWIWKIDTMPKIKNFSLTILS